MRTPITRPTGALVAALALCLVSCQSMVGEGPPSGAASLGYTSDFWARGLATNLEGAMQGDISVTVPTADGGSVTLLTWATMDMSNDVGDASGVPGNGGQISEVDLGLDYSRNVGDTLLSVGLLSYEYPNTGASSTAEVYAAASWSVLGVEPSVAAYVDFVEAEDVYLNASVARGFEVSEDLALNLAASLGWMGAGQTEFNFGRDSSALSDLWLRAGLDWSLDALTTLSLSLNGVRVLDSSVRDDLDAAGRETDGIWVTLGVSFGF